jgi:hypothetical protein
VVWIAVVIGFTILWSSSFALAKHHKRKKPTPTPTTTTRIYNPRDMQDPHG